MMDIERFGKTFPVRMVSFSDNTIHGSDKGAAYYTAYKYKDSAGNEHGKYVRFRGFCFPSFCGGFVVHSVQCFDILRYGKRNPNSDFWGTNVYRDHATRSSYRLDNDYYARLSGMDKSLGYIQGGLGREGTVFFDYDYVMERLPDLTPESVPPNWSDLKHDVAALSILAAAAQMGRRGIVWADYIGGPTYRAMRAMETLAERWTGTTCLLRRSHMIPFSRPTQTLADRPLTITERESSLWRVAGDIPETISREEYTYLHAHELYVPSGGKEFVNSNSGNDVYSGTHVLPRISFLYQNQPFTRSTVNGVNPDLNFALDSVLASTAPWTN